VFSEESSQAEAGVGETNPINMTPIDIAEIQRLATLVITKFSFEYMDKDTANHLPHD
jgi:hypothetical protein